MIKISSYNRSPFARVGADLVPKLQIDPSNPNSLLSTSTDSEAIDKIALNADILKHDILVDACSDSYNEFCKGLYPDVDSITSSIKELKKINPETDLSLVLMAAGVDPSDSNIEELGKCIKNKPSYPTVYIEDMVTCVVAIKSKKGIPKSHTTKDFRDKFLSWHGSFVNFKKRVDEVLDYTTSEEAKKWTNEYNDFRNDFIKNGGKTSAVGVGLPNAMPYVYWGIAIVGALLVLYTTSAGATAIASLKTAFGKKSK